MSSPAGAEAPLVHNVYFSLRDAGPAACEQLLAACRKYLAVHDGIVWFGCGTRAAGLAREVNDKDFDVSLHIVFGTLSAHDAYQTSPEHLRFIDENRANWKRVRVFDSFAPGGLSGVAR
jgi:hypothetical protein